MIISIDIGTSYSSISMLDPDGKAQSIDIGTGVSMFGSKYSLPSAVFVEDDGRILLGQAAMNSRMRNFQNFRDEFKRNLGENIPILLGNRSFLPEDLYAEFFRHMKGCAESVSGEKIELAYLTYPASYGKSKKDKITSAANAAGLFDLELVDEPTAAAMCYCAAGYIKESQNLLIYDFGGGTFDVAVIRYENDTFSPLAAPKGLERCGGIDIDRLIFRDMMSKVPAETMEMLQKNSVHYMRLVSQLSELAVKCKHHLSSADHFAEDIVVGFDYIPYSLTLEQYNQMIAGLVGQTIQTCRQALEEAKLKVSDLSAVLLVGGTSRVRLVREMVEQMAGSVPVYCAADLELAVSQGALNYRNYKQESQNQEEPVDDEPVEIEQKNEREYVADETDFEDDNASKAQAEFQRGRQFAEEGNWDDAYLSFFKAVQLGSAEAMYDLASCHKNGLGTEVDLTLAEIWFEEAAEHGVHRAKQYSKKEKNLAGSSAGENNNEARAEFINGRKLARQKQWDAAFKSFFKAAKLGDTDAMYSLAEFYKQGLGTQKNSELADIWYRRATESRVGKKEQMETETPVVQQKTDSKPNAQDNNAAKENPYFLNNQGLQYSREGRMYDAFECYFKAAKQGYPDAQYHLGTCFERGYGTQIDLHKAKTWYGYAAVQGHTAAADKLNQLKKTQKPQETKNTSTPEQIIRKLLKEMPELNDDDRRWSVKSSKTMNSVSWLGRLQQQTGVLHHSMILLAQDTTLFNSGKEGLIFTKKGIHVYGGWLAPLKLYDWEGFAKSELTIENNGNTFSNGSYISGSNWLPHKFWTRLHEEMKKLY